MNEAIELNRMYLHDLYVRHGESLVNRLEEIGELNFFLSFLHSQPILTQREELIKEEISKKVLSEYE